MSHDRPVNMAHSAHQRLLNLSRKAGLPFEGILQDFGIERFLYRLGKTSGADGVALKGAILLRAWGAPLSRPTMDIDLSGRKGLDLDGARALLAEAADLDVEDDGMRYDIRTLREGPIAPGLPSAGTRWVMGARLGRSRVRLQVDLTLGEEQAENARRVDLPVLLDLPAPRMWGYAPEGVVAEKLHAMVRLGLANSRVRDFFDVAFLARTVEFDGENLLPAIRATFERRRTPLPPGEPVAFTLLYFRDPVKIIQWESFARRFSGEGGGGTLEETVTACGEFLGPPILALAGNRGFPMRWEPGGPWRGDKVSE